MVYYSIMYKDKDGFTTCFTQSNKLFVFTNPGMAKVKLQELKKELQEQIEPKKTKVKVGLFKYEVKIVKLPEYKERYLTRVLDTMFIKRVKIV